MAFTGHILWFALYSACADPQTGTNTTTINGSQFRIEITTVTPAAQADLFSQIDGLQLIIDQGDGTQSTHVLAGDSEGQEATNDTVPPLNDATLTLLGRQDAQVIFYGESPRLTITEGSHEISILVARNNAMATLDELPKPLAMAPVVSVGDGRFYFFGGTDSGARESESNTSIVRLDLGQPDDELTASTISTVLPALGDDGGYMGHTATMIGGLGEHAGKVVVAGGSPLLLSGGGTITGQEETSDRVFLFDPDTETIDEIDSLSHPRREHRAVTGPNGEVVVIGGFSRTTSPSISVADFVEIYDADADEWQTASPPLSAGGLYSAAARAGDQGVLVCGGIDASFEYNSLCQMVTSSGVIESAASLDEPLVFADMVTLEDGRVLLTGGLTPGDDEFTYLSTPELDATDAAWLYEAGNWRQLAPMKDARAMHGTALLPGGRVLIAGGVSGVDPTAERVGVGYSGIMYDHALALACAEIFDPETETFSAIDPCGPGSSSATLPERVLMPAVAADSTVGAIVAGGIGVDRGRSVDSVLLYHPAYSSKSAE